MIRNLKQYFNARCKIGVNGAHGEPYAYRFNGGYDSNLEKPIYLRDIHKYNEPLIIYDTYYHEACDARVVFPPFSDYTVENGTYEPHTFTCSGFVNLFSYILDNDYDLISFGCYNMHHIICVIRDYGWKYAVTPYGELFTEHGTGRVIIGFRNVIQEIEREFFEI